MLLHNYEKYLQNSHIFIIESIKLGILNWLVLHNFFLRSFRIFMKLIKSSNRQI